MDVQAYHYGSYVSSYDYIGGYAPLILVVDYATSRCELGIQVVLEDAKIFRWCVLRVGSYLT